MTKNEILLELEEKGIIILIGDEYHLTEKYKDLLLSEIKIKSLKDSDAPVENKNNITLKKEKEVDKASFYPSDVLKQTGRARAVAFMEFCKIPIYPPKGDKKYRLRSLTKNSIQIITNIVENPDEFDPQAMVNVIKSYYSNIDMPKSFKNFAEEDLMEMYLEYLTGNALTSIDNSKENTSWG
jgi:hypothetical protein